MGLTRFSCPVQVLAFHHILRKEFGVFCTVRQEMGQDISGACGQLVVEQQQQGGCGGGSGRGGAGAADIEELGRRLKTTAVA